MIRQLAPARGSWRPSGSGATQAVMYTVNNSEQLRELSTNDLNFLDTSEDGDESEAAAIEGLKKGDGPLGCGNSAVRELDNILEQFEAEAQLLLSDPGRLLNCKYHLPVVDFWDGMRRERERGRDKIGAPN